MNPGGAMLGWAGSLRSDDAPWGPHVVGRHFAVDEPDEHVPGGTHVRRWYLITAYSQDDAGVHRLSVQRHWWGAKNGHGISRLYRADNFTNDASTPRRLKYIIAPGANAYDVSRGVLSGPEHSGGALEYTIVLSPGPHDFAAGDPIEQAIGADPFRPVPFRSWVWDRVPGVWPSPIFDIANRGSTSRHAVMTVGGGPASREAINQRADGSPPWSSYLRFDTAVHTGLAFDADVADAAIVLNPIAAGGNLFVWNRTDAGGGDRAAMRLSDQGDLVLHGITTLDVTDQSLTRVQGVSGGAHRADDLRGVGLSVVAGRRELTVEFRTRMPDADYAVMVQPSWLTQHAVTNQSEQGFTVQFNREAPANATLSWMLIR